MTLLIDMKETFLANILMMRKHQVKLKQPWIAETGLKELTHQYTKNIPMGISPPPTTDQ